MSAPRTLDVASLPRYGFGARDLAWWAAVGAIAVELTMYGVLFVSYFYIRDRAGVWPPISPRDGALLPATVATAALVLALVPMHQAARAAGAVALSKARVGVLSALGLMVPFAVFAGLMLAQLPFALDQNAHASVVWTLFGFLLFHAIGCALWLLLAAVRLQLRATPEELPAVKACALHFDLFVLSWAGAYAIVFFDPSIA